MSSRSAPSKVAVPPAKRERARESLPKESFTIATSAGEKIRPGPETVPSRRRGGRRPGLGPRPLVSLDQVHFCSVKRAKQC